MTHISTIKKVQLLEESNAKLRKERDEFERLLLDATIERDQLKTRVTTLIELQR